MNIPIINTTNHLCQLLFAQGNIYYIDFSVINLLVFSKTNLLFSPQLNKLMPENTSFYPNLKNSIYNELINASHGQKTSFLYGKIAIPTKSISSSNKAFQVMVVGGSNFTSSILKRENGVLQTLQTTRENTPTLDNKEVLTNLIIKHLDSKIEVLVLNFAFKMQTLQRNGILDGELLNGSKGHILADLISKTIGYEIEAQIFEKLGKKITVTVCNDTVSLGLAGVYFLNKNKLSNQKIAVAIVGTGFNSGFFDTPNSFINLESANFNNFKHSQTLEILDKQSSNPGINMFDKEFSGRYLPKHFNLICAQNGLNMAINDSHELSKLAQNDHSQAGDIARELLIRGANMVAAHIAALADFMLENGPKQRLNLFIEGSVFWKAFEFEKNVKIALKELTDKEIVIREIEDSAILGTAQLVG